MQYEFLSLKEIERTKTLLPFGKSDVIVLTEWGRQTRKEGRDFSFSRSAAEDRDTVSWLNTGLLILQSRALDIEILLIKAKNEEAIYRQESLYLSFVGNYSTDQWAEGAASGSLATALRIIGNLEFPVKGDHSTRAVSDPHVKTEMS